VRVDGVVATLGMRVAPDARIEVDGALIAVAGARRTFMLNKPAGVLSSVGDERGRPTVVDLLPPVPGLHPVGRLDLDSEGLLLLTNDGELTLALTHPRYGQRKRYRVWTRPRGLDALACERLCRGVELEDGSARALEAKPADGGAEVVLGEGRKRQLRRMLQAIGFHVTRLLRTHIGKLELGELGTGAWRELTAEELAHLGYTPGQEPQRRAAAPAERGAEGE
jgi:23S rRNA pseudouridine2605 synthase